MLDALLYKEEVYWKQRARVRWLHAGDKNTKFFHKQATLRRKTNTIKYLKDNEGRVVNTQEEIANLVVSHFSDLFSTQGCSVDAAAAIFDVLGPGLENSDVEFLAQDFTADEVKKAVFQLSGDKAVGLDGFNAYFYQKNWAVLGRVIFDNIIIANELVHAINNRKSGKKGWAALKLDMAKAFDRVEWDFLSNIMFHFNFPVRFVSLILKCLSSASISFSINGSVHGNVKPTRGIRQCDPLSLYLFILCAESLSAILRNYQHRGLLHGISISRNAPPISHLLFADDSILFCAADRNSSGKETLIKAVLQAIPSYAMSCFRIPTRICREIESLISKFWWGSSPETRKIHWKNWRMVCQSKFVGGLGFRSLIHFNQAMLAKQAWRVFKSPDSLLSLVLKARYFPNTSILDAGPGHSPSYTWRSILWGRDLMKQGLIWKVGDGSTIRTIEDHWLPHSRIKSYSSLPPSESTLSFFLSPSGAWDPIKLHQFFDEQTIDHILDVPISGNGCSDDLIWSRNSSGIFTVKSAYHLAVTSRDIPSSSSFDQCKRFWSKIWSSSVPSKVKHLVWRVLSNSVPVASLLFFRHIISSPVCPLCHSEWETVEHAFLGCVNVKKAWKHSPLFQFYSNNKGLSIYDFIALAMDILDKSDCAIFFCFIWLLWNHRNNLYHNKKLLPPWHLYDQAVSYLLEYEHANLPGFKPENVNFRCIGQVQLSQQEGWRVSTDAGVSNSDRKHSLGVVVTDEKDDIKAGLIIPIVGSVPPEVAEAKAVLAAISWVQATKLPVNILQTDCKSIIDKVYNTNCHNSVVNDLVMCIRNSLLFSPNLVITHVPRELNKTAHVCARVGLGLDNECIWNGSLPSFVT
uniref:Reverse transcriptase n=1 Tax=Cannabis sativa TaxID=3483 RepID=A0A803NK25_CANSA